MKEFEEIGRYLFSGKFPLVLPPFSRDKLRALVLDISVARRPKTVYFSKRTNPETSFFASIVSLQRTLPMQRYDVEFVTQRFMFTGSDDEQVLPAMYCYHQEVISTLVALGNALGAIGIVVPESVNYSPMRLFPDQLNFVCYAETALNVVVYKLEYETCTPFEEQVPLPPPPLPSLPSFPSDIPILPGDGYSPNDGNEGDYEPFPGDNDQDGNDGLPTGEECELVTLRWSFEIPGGSPNIVEELVYGEVLSQRTEEILVNFYQIYVTCRGNLTTGCVPSQEFALSTSPGVSATFLGRVN